MFWHLETTHTATLWKQPAALTAMDSVQTGTATMRLYPLVANSSPMLVSVLAAEVKSVV